MQHHQSNPHFPHPHDAHPADPSEQIIPVIAERLNISRRTVDTGRVTVTTRPEYVEHTVDEPLYRDEVTVERIPIGVEVPSPPPVRQEGPTTIIPVVEEVLVLVKRLIVTEEVRITRRTVQERRPQTVHLRRDRAVVERWPAGPPVQP